MALLKHSDATTEERHFYFGADYSIVNFIVNRRFTRR